MIKISKKHSVISLAILITLILAFFPSSSFISKPFIVDTNLKQQNYNEAGMFTISPFEAAQYFYYAPAGCFWIDLRNADEFKKSHLKVALNQSLKQLQYTKWNADDLILVYGDNTADAQEAVAFLRQVKNARAFAVKGGFTNVNKFLIQPIGISITTILNDQNLEHLIQYRNKISGQSNSTDKVLEKLKSAKPKAIREGC